MDSDTLQDLKQFISVTISQQLALQTKELRQELRTDLREDLAKLEVNLLQEIRDVDTKLDTILNVVGGDIAKQQRQLTNHERRISRLERKTA